MREDVALWIVQFVVLTLIGIIGWGGRKLLSDLEDRFRTSDEMIVREITALRRDFDERNASVDRRNSDIMMRLGKVEQSSAADSAILNQVVTTLKGLTDRIDDLYRFLTRQGG